MEDASEGRLHANTAEVGHEAMVALLESRGVEFTTWEGWELLDAYEQALGEATASFRAVAARASASRSCPVVR